MEKLILLLTFCCFSVFGYSQYRYELSLESFNGYSPKKAYSLICKKIEFTNRRIVGDTLVFESKNAYSRDRMERIVELADFELQLFRVIPRQEEYLENK